MSLGAGNTGRSFDQETDRRVAAFKFIRWQGGPESIRQNSVFKDFFLLAEHDTVKRRYLYVLGNHYPLKFLRQPLEPLAATTSDGRPRILAVGTA